MTKKKRRTKKVRYSERPWPPKTKKAQDNFDKHCKSK